MPDSVPPPPATPSANTPAVRRGALLSATLGFLLALACALWAGAHFAHSTSSIAYGALTGLSFGALFAFGQRIKLIFVPASGIPKKKRRISPGPVAALRPAQRAAANAKPLSVTFDENQIQTGRGTGKLDSIRWDELGRVVIDISAGKLPIPCWVLFRQDGERSIRIPNDALGIEQLTEQFKLRLPGYDNEATTTTIISAMGATQGSFELWRQHLAPGSGD